MAGSAAIIGTVFQVAGTVRAERQQSRADKERRKLQKIQERRERNRLFAERQRAVAESQVALGARGALSSSAAENVIGSIRSQEATEQGFLSKVSRITGSVNTFQVSANRSLTFGNLLGAAGNTTATAINEGFFKKSPPTPKKS